jgi:GrpB-like predicted nucleotidyltransferase (UPF0157 family)
MFRVPSSGDAPTFDQTFEVGFVRWLTSNATDRREWQVRRQIATRLQADQARAARAAKYEPQLAELRARAAEIRAEIAAKMAAQRR